MGKQKVNTPCGVSWGLPNALTEEPDECNNDVEYCVYLDCGHDSTIAYKKDSPGFVCREHLEYLMKHSGLGICGCHWIIIPITEIIEKQTEKEYWFFAHELNKKYLKSIGRVCLCADCADM